jgi:hypothetical protein
VEAALFWSLVAVAAGGWAWSLAWDCLRGRADRVSPYRSLYFDRIGTAGALLSAGALVVGFSLKSPFWPLVACLVLAGLVWKVAFDYLWFRATGPWRPAALKYEGWGATGCLLWSVAALAVSAACATSTGLIR